MADVRVGLLPTFQRDQITSPEYVSGFALLAEEMGCESIWIAEHPLVASDYKPRYPYSSDGRMPIGPDIVMPDPIEWLTFIAANTSRIHLGTAVLVLPLHPPGLLAKRVSTLDNLSKGRMIIGIGVGWQEEEFRALSVPFKDRGRRCDEYVAALRSLWSEDVASFCGEFVDVRGMQCDPHPFARRAIPIVVGGSSVPAAKRAGHLGDGFYPYAIEPDAVAELLEPMRAAAREAGRDPAKIELTCRPDSGRAADPFTIDYVRRFVDLGATRIIISAERAGCRSLQEVRDFVGRYFDNVVSKL